MDRLPPEAQTWIKGMNSEERHCTEIVLNNVGADSFVRYWKDHADDLEYVRNF
jgi:hypothetical protein